MGVNRTTVVLLLETILHRAVSVRNLLVVLLAIGILTDLSNPLLVLPGMFVEFQSIIKYLFQLASTTRAYILLARLSWLLCGSISRFL